MTKIINLACILMVVLCGCVPAVRTSEPSGNGVRFFYSNPDATGVSIAGDFNHWEPAKNPLSGPGKNGLWSITLPLAPGRYEYRFVVNGTEWVLDPAAPSVDDGMGGRNSVIIVEP